MPLRLKWLTPIAAHISRTSGLAPSSSSHTSSTPSCSMRSAASSVRRTIISGSRSGTIVVRNATRVPGVGKTGLGSRASSEALQSVETLISANSPITPVLSDHHDRRHVQGGVLGVVRPVARQHQPDEEAAHEQQREHHEQRGAHRTQLHEALEPDAVWPVRGRLAQLPGERREAGIVIASRRRDADVVFSIVASGRLFE